MDSLAFAVNISLQISNLIIKDLKSVKPISFPVLELKTRPFLHNFHFVKQQCTFLIIFFQFFNLDIIVGSFDNIWIEFQCNVCEVGNHYDDRFMFLNKVKYIYLTPLVISQILYNNTIKRFTTYA